MTKSFTDMMGRGVKVPFPPRRIISVVPSQTELLYDLGLDDEVVGITKFCVHPEGWFRDKTRVGGTKTLNLEKIRALQPDLIIANKEENDQEQIETLAKEYPVWVSDISTIEEALRMIDGVGAIVNREAKANELIKDIVSGFESLQRSALKKRVAYLIWYQPWMAAGADTFISNMIETIGWENVFKDQGRYPEISIEALKEYRPDVVLLSSEPFPFKDRHAAEIKEAMPEVDVKLVDGEMFSWYGSRMLKAVSYFSEVVKDTY
jgi:ABC-type Fe3+-hydroxamate transport system substrate-binding protein